LEVSGNVDGSRFLKAINRSIVYIRRGAEIYSARWEQKSHCIDSQQSLAEASA
uniref:Transposase n=1 Tax=Haemonchus placei TaxID=6290 RepID=A0A0N4W1W2_HAEPC